MSSFKDNSFFIYDKILIFSIITFLLFLFFFIARFFVKKIKNGETGEVSGRERFIYEQAQDVLSNEQFKMQFGLQKEQLIKVQIN